jgi:hypothetical protein
MVLRYIEVYRGSPLYKEKEDVVLMSPMAPLPVSACKINVKGGAIGGAIRLWQWYGGFCNDTAARVFR